MSNFTKNKQPIFDMNETYLRTTRKSRVLADTEEMWLKTLVGKGRKVIFFMQ